MSIEMQKIYFSLLTLPLIARNIDTSFGVDSMTERESRLAELLNQTLPRLNRLLKMEFIEIGERITEGLLVDAELIKNVESALKEVRAGSHDVIVR